METSQISLYPPLTTVLGIEHATWVPEHSFQWALTLQASTGRTFDRHRVLSAPPCFQLLSEDLRSHHPTE